MPRTFPRGWNRFAGGRFFDRLLWPPRSHAGARDGVVLRDGYGGAGLWFDGADADDPQATVCPGRSFQSCGCAGDGSGADLCLRAASTGGLADLGRSGGPGSEFGGQVPGRAQTGLAAGAGRATRVEAVQLVESHDIVDIVNRFADMCVLFLAWKYSQRSFDHAAIKSSQYR